MLYTAATMEPDLTWDATWKVVAIMFGSVMAVTTPGMLILLLMATLSG